MPINNLVDEPMCPHCHSFLEYDYGHDFDFDDEDNVSFNDEFFCPLCHRRFLVKSFYNYVGCRITKELD